MSSLVEEVLCDFLRADPEVQRLCGGRIYPFGAPQDKTLPYITYQLISTDDALTVDGPQDTIGTQYQWDVWGKTAAEAKRVASALRDARGGNSAGRRFHGFVGKLSDISLQLVKVETEREDYEAPSDGAGTGLYRRTMEITVWYVRP